MTDISVVNVFSPLVRQTPGMQGSQPGERILSDWTVSRQAHTASEAAVIAASPLLTHVLPQFPVSRSEEGDDVRW